MKLVYLVKTAGAVVLILVLLVIAGCFIQPQPLTETEIRARVSRDRSVLTKNQDPLNGPVDLYEAMARALKYNLDVRVEVMQKMLAHQNLKLAHYEMLPKLVANGAFDQRNNFNGGTSVSLLTGRESLEASTSSEKDVFSGNLMLSWDVLDFGLSYIRARQAADNVLIAEEEKRRVAGRVLQDVRTAYWRAVSAERMLDRLEFLDEWIGKALENTKIIQQKKLESPLVSLQYQRELIDKQRDIQKLYRELATAKVELASMMNLPPGQYYELLAPEFKEDRLPELGMAVEEMEFQALLNRPELRTVDYRRRINAKETKAAILELLPNINVELGGYYNSNKLLFNSNWLAYGSKVSWNLIKLFQQPVRLRSIEARQKILEAQSLALTMTVMTQVHIRLAQLAYAKKELVTAQRYYRTQVKIAQQTRLEWTANRVGVHELIRERVNEVVAELRHNTAKSNVQTAYANLLASIGQDPLPNTMSAASVPDLANALRTHWEALSGRAAKNAPQKDSSVGVG